MQYNQNASCYPSTFSTDANTLQAECDTDTLIRLFNQTFAAQQAPALEPSTYLIAQASEPIYVPAHTNLDDYFCPVDSRVETLRAGVSAKIRWLGKAPLAALPKGNKIFFTRDYFASALHEVAHWCVACSERRQQVDYGYWYAPDGRNACQQLAFEQVEAVPQAIEWAFALACNKAFRVSNDNLSLQKHDSSRFETCVLTQLVDFANAGFPARAQRFLQVLHLHYNTPSVNERLNLNRLEGVCLNIPC
jgi:hypothetical protein